MEDTDDPDAYARRPTTTWSAVNEVVRKPMRWGQTPLLLGMKVVPCRAAPRHAAGARSPPITVSVLIRYDPVELSIYLDARPETTAVEALVVEHACPYLQAEEVPLPVPYTVWLLHRSGESQRFVPKPEPIARGLLSRCPVP